MTEASHEYIMISGNSARRFNLELKGMAKDGWYPWGELQSVVVVHPGSAPFIVYSALLERIAGDPK